MNDILQLKGQFEQKGRNNRPGPSNIPKGKSVQLDHLMELKSDLESVCRFWETDTLKINPLVSAYYTDVVAKSNRIKSLLSKGGKSANSSIVGAKFAKSDYKKHIITHCVGKDIILESISRLEKSISIVRKEYGTSISHGDIELLNSKLKKYNESKLAKTNFVNTIVDAYYLEKFGIELDADDFSETTIITIYNTGVSTNELMRRLKIDFLPVRSIDETTLLLTPDQYKSLKEKAPYLIAMAVSDISELTKEDFSSCSEKTINIPKPTTEPIIGVIDTMFDSRVYFSEWVEFTNMLDPNIPLEPADFDHGTKVSSIIVDGPSANPDLDDGCGRFRVRHFGVATSRQFSSFTVLRAIKDIVVQNKDIKVWNLSLGSSMEISPNFISPEAAILDQIQYENDVIFVVAGTNKTSLKKGKQRIGAPADSINALVVNSVDFENYPASYSREGLVLSFFNKPDISYYGGEGMQGIRTCSPTGECISRGTSYAAPWISRKLAYLIEVIGLSREIAKALIIDAAAGWVKMNVPSQLVGYGVVPKRIEDIVQSKDDEIRFVLSGISEKYDTYNFKIPVPVHKEKQPYIVKATLCYFPKCSRNQGVDYTNTEMDLHFGRLKGTEIKTINDNEQGLEGINPLYEGTARRLYRRWDNVKHISEKIKSRHSPKKVYENGLWGISIKTKERLDGKDGVGLSFGVVITLKEINGVNRIEDFIHQCAFRGWIVNRIDVINRIDIYNKAAEEVHFDD